MNTVSGLIAQGVLRKGLPQVIDMLPGEYLSDVIQSITDASETKPYTINFYNHSKTVNWETFTAKIHVPEYMNINFVGKMNCFNNSDFFTNEFSISKMFLGFDFSRDAFALSGLPSDTTSIALSSKFEEGFQIESLAELNDISFGDLFYLSEPFIHIKETQQIFYIKPNNEKIECTVSFENVNFTYDQISKCMDYTNCQAASFNYANCQSALFNAANCQSAYFGYANCQSALFNSANNQLANFNYSNCQSASFSSANCQSANFGYANCQSAYFGYANCQSALFNSANCQSANFGSANLKNVNWANIVSIVGANFQNADLTGGTNLPERINTKAKWIAECGAGKVNAATKWIDGTSILS